MKLPTIGQNLDDVKHLLRVFYDKNVKYDEKSIILHNIWKTNTNNVLFTYSLAIL